jgi:putative acetyltransferase
MSVHINMDNGLQIRHGRPEDRPVLFDVWLRSVEATHAFVPEADIQSFKPLVRDYLASDKTEFWILCNTDGVVAGFMGMAGPSWSPFFWHPNSTNVAAGGG